MLSIIACITAIVTGLTALITYLLGKPRRIRLLQDRRNKLEKDLRQALADNDTVAISTITLELNRVRKALSDLGAK